MTTAPHNGPRMLADIGCPSERSAQLRAASVIG
jgi:hypothetical protein